MGDDDKKYLNPPEIARLFGVSVNRVLGWINGHELRAINVAERTSKRPRWRVRREWLESWERARMTTPEPTAPRPRQRKALEVKQFYS